MSNDTCDIELPDSLVSQIETRLPESNFDSVDAYVKFVMEEVLESIEYNSNKTGDEDEEIQERLRSLGYRDE